MWYNYGGMDNKPIISILSSVYNERLYIEQTIRGVLNQTYENWEWIILYDGSTDGTGEILRGIKDERVRCVFQENTGHVAKNMNRILKMSRGDIIATLDGDDYWPENKCEIQIKSFDDQDVVLSYGECVLVNSKGEKLGHIGVPEESSIAHNNPTGSALKRLLVDIDCFICNTSVMYRKSSLSDAGGFVEVDGLPHDFSTWVKLSLSGRFCPIPACLGYYRKHLKSATFTMEQDYYFKKQVDFLRDFCLENVQRFRDLGLPCHIDTLQDHWNRIGQKNRMIYRLTELSLFMRVDFVNPLICFVNQKSSMKKVLKRFLRI